MGTKRAVLEDCPPHAHNAASQTVRQVTVQVADFTETLRQAIAESRGAGLELPARELEATVFAAYTTSSEYLGEVGAAVSRFLKMNSRELPPATAAKLRSCLAEVGKVWPKYRP